MRVSRPHPPQGELAAAQLCALCQKSALFVFCSPWYLRYRWPHAAKLGAPTTRHANYRYVEWRPPIRSSCRDMLSDCFEKVVHATFPRLFAREHVEKVQNDPRALRDKRLPMESNRHLTGSLQCEHTVLPTSLVCTECTLLSLQLVISFGKAKTTATNTKRINHGSVTHCALSATVG
jgi:hypothetical protein